MAFAPNPRALPGTVTDAVDPESVTVPRVVRPALKVMVPVGAALPLEGLIVAVTTVFAAEEIAV